MANVNNKAAQQAAVVASSVIVELDKLALVRETFEKTELARTNQSLYQILADVYAQYKVAASNNAALKDAIEAMRKNMEKDGMRVQSNSLAISVFVRYVFKADRQRVHNYSRALQAAISHNIEPNGLAAYITNAGGIEECKQKVTLKPETLERQLKIEQALPLVDEVLFDSNKPVLASFTVDSQLVKASYAEGLTFMVGRADASGNVDVLQVIPAYSKGVEDWAKKQLAKYITDEHEASAVSQQTKAVANSIDAAVAQASSNAPVDANATVKEVMTA